MFRYFYGNPKIKSVIASYLSWQLSVFGSLVSFVVFFGTCENNVCTCIKVARENVNVCRYDISRVWFFCFVKNCVSWCYVGTLKSISNKLTLLLQGTSSHNLLHEFLYLFCSCKFVWYLFERLFTVQNSYYKTSNYKLTNRIKVLFKKFRVEYSPHFLKDPFDCQTAWFDFWTMLSNKLVLPLVGF